MGKLISNTLGLNSIKNLNAAIELCNKGVIEHKNNNLELAKKYYKESLKFNPRHEEAYLNLGIIYFQEKDLQQAIVFFEQSISLIKKFEQSFVLLASCYNMLENERMMIKIINKGLLSLPKSLELLKAKSTYLIKHGKFDEALIVQKTICEILNINIYDSPEYVRSLIFSGDEAAGKQIAIKNLDKPLFKIIYAELLSLNDEKKKAFELIQDLADNGNNLAINVISTCTHDNDSFLFAEKKLLLDFENLNKENKISKAFSLAMIYNKNNKFDEAFRFAEIGHSLLEQPNEQYFRDIFTNTKKIFTNDFYIKNKQEYKCKTDPIFIVGMPRSGTSVLEQILSMNKNITPLGESIEVSKLVNYYSPYGRRDLFPFYIKEFTKKSFQEIGKKYCKEIGSGIFTDKLPHNFLNVGFINAILPNAKIVYIERDIKDVAISIWLRNFAGQHLYANNFKFLLEYSRLYLDLMNYWESLNYDNFYKISYSDLVNNTNDELEKLTRFLNLSNEFDYLNFYKSDRVVKTASKEQVRKPINNKSIGHWKNYSKFFE